MIILFATSLGNNKIKLDILFIIKDIIHNVFDNRLNINPNIHLEKQYIRKAIKNRHNRCIIKAKRNNNIYKALLYNDDSNFFIFVPVKIYKNNIPANNYSNPVIDLSNFITMNNNKKAYQNIRRLIDDSCNSNIFNIYHQIKNQIFQQGYYLGIKFL